MIVYFFPTGTTYCARRAQPIVLDKHNLLCSTILDCISTSCAYVLLLLRTRSPARHAARDRARAAAVPSTVS